MKHQYIACIAMLLLTTSCASTVDIKNRVDNHYKAAAYLESIGQKDIAQEEYRQAQKELELGNQLIPLLIDIFDHF
ncbi:hypothetical protein [Thalassotalea fusca]